MSDARERILRAAVEAAAIHGLSRLSVADVAKRAGLSRPTLYKQFESKDALVAAAVQREAAAIVDAVRTVVETTDDPHAALEAGVLTALRLVRDHPLLDRVVRTEPEVLVPLLTTDDGMVLAAIRLPVEQMVAAGFPRLGAVATRRIADLLTRLLVSYALSAPDDPPEVVAALIAGLLYDGARSLPAVLARVAEESA
ncbi:MAG TPA: TetR family transcriptional regulator [Acidimicrobiales bacterium]